MRTIEFHGRSLEDIRIFPAEAKRELGYQLERIQRGLNPTDWKPVSSIGRGAREIRIQCRGQYRLIYLTNMGDSIVVLHAFIKKSRRTSKTDIERARRIFRQATRR